MPACRRRIALAATALLVAAVAIAAADPIVRTGAISVRGAGVGSVTVRGNVVILGAIAGPGRIEVRTGRSAAVVGMNSRQRRVAPNRDVFIKVPAGASFGVTTGHSPFRVTIRGRGISATIAGTGAVTFVGRGTYLPYGASRPRPWPRTPVQLRQPSDRTLVRTATATAVARARPGA